MFRKAVIFASIVALGFQSCDQNDETSCVFQPNIEDKVNVEIESLEDQILDMNSRDSLHAFLKDNPVIANYFFRRRDYPNDSIMIQSLLRRFNNPHIDTLQMEIDKIFGDKQQLKDELALAFSHLKYYYPEATIPKVQTVATGMDFDLFVSDSLIVIGLDYYLGPEAKFRPNMYEYILKRYAPEYIVPSIMLLTGISAEYNNTDISDKTILADMISYGKAFYFAKHMMPCTPDRTMIWYTKEEIEGSHENEDLVWAHFVENELLYETSHLVKNKYIDDRPKTYEIGDKAPGRIGTWLGWQIVKAYMDRYPEVELSQLMNTADAKRIFEKSKYKPEKKGLF